jgi:EAL domain-containing protein (putative c-di-GMP-specific phosphodiesterase class I)/DNA-binding NarL/FixJ family response regulator
MPEAPNQGVNCVLYLGTDPTLRDLARASAAGLGVPLRGCRTLAGLALAASLEPARVLILEMAALVPGWTPDRLLERVQAESGVRPLLLCLGEAGSARGNGDRLVLQPPFEGTRLSEALERLLHRALPENGRVLLLGDSPIQDAFHARLLRGAGIRVDLVSDPGQVEAAVERLRPHLAILDLEMETAGEGSLDSRIRDCPACQDLPIIFLSGDLPDGEGVEGRRIGGDDYLVKPVAPEQLIATVRARLAGSHGPEAGLGARDVPGAGLVQTGFHFLQRIDKEIAEVASPGLGQAILYVEASPGPEPPGRGSSLDVPGFQRLIADRLSALVEPGDRAAWLSDQGLALWVSRRDEAEVSAFAERILGALTAPSADAQADPALGTVSVGVGPFLPTADDAQTLISRAQSACVRAQAAGGTRVVVHQSPGGDGPRGGDLETGSLDGALGPLLRRALGGEGFRLVYQPILPLRKLADQRYEVLLRLRTPEGAIIPPLSFLPVARRLGLLPALDRWVLSGALSALRQERDAGRPTRFLIHQTPESLAIPNWLSWVRDAILRLDLIRQRPVLEFNAQGILVNEAQARQIFPELTRLGIEVCLTGIIDSKDLLGLIRRRGVTCVKLARELASVGTSRGLKASVEALHKLGVRVIASGIEEPEMIGRVWSSGVDYIQGNLIQFPEETLEFNFGETAHH